MVGRARRVYESEMNGDRTKVRWLDKLNENLMECDLKLSPG